jgi:hypothetical protein
VTHTETIIVQNYANEDELVTLLCDFLGSKDHTAWSLVGATGGAELEKKAVFSSLWGVSVKFLSHRQRKGAVVAPGQLLM